MEVGDLQARTRACKACPCYQSRDMPVIYRGAPVPELLFVGQSPGKVENELGVPFVGPAGKLLNDQLTLRPNLPPWGIINLINCMPPGKFQRAYATACRPFLLEKLARLVPAVHHLVTIGNDAEQEIAEIRRLFPVTFDGIELHSILHPSAVLRHPSWESRWLSEWERLMERLREDGVYRD